MARIWENVLDWEHLPWLHGSSFVGIELLEFGREGWRAWVSFPPSDAPHRALIAVELHRLERYYWTRTREGIGTGSEIRTTLTPTSATATDIAVEFFVPGVAAEHADQVGSFYTTLYAQLWDEDEAMMMRRQEVLDCKPTPSGLGDRLGLGPLAALRERLPFVTEANGQRIRLVEIDGTIVPHVTVCPHLGGPLELAEVCDGIATCPWHGYRFDLRTGKSADGRSLCLATAPRFEIDAEGEASLLW